MTWPAALALWFVGSIPFGILVGKCIKYGGLTPRS